MGAPTPEKIGLVPGVERPVLEVDVEGPVLESYSALLVGGVDPDHLANVRAGPVERARRFKEPNKRAFQRAGGTLGGTGREAEMRRCPGLSKSSTLAQLSRETGRGKSRRETKKKAGAGFRTL